MFAQVAQRSNRRCGAFDAQTGEFYSYSRVDQLADEVAAKLVSPEKRLVLLLADNSLGSLVAYLAALRSGNAVMLASATADESFIRRYVDSYHPEWILGPSNRVVSLDVAQVVGTSISGLTVGEARSLSEEAIHADLAMLLLTSGSTGSPKAVRLTRQNLVSNAAAICEYLRIDGSETAITSLPMSYSYGMSVLNSHLHAGANLVLTNASATTSAFWDLFRARSCTSLAGVPFTYEILQRLRFVEWHLPALRYVTQAGGRLPQARAREFASWAAQKGVRFYVMYGQTEASPRISYVPPERLLDKVGSIGIPIPGGRLWIESSPGVAALPGDEGQIVYRGPNVMMGYAHSRTCLAKGDELAGLLHTGDIGHADSEGYFFVTGRSKRFLKLFGLRIGLDEVETLVESFLDCPVACVGSDEGLVIVVASSAELDPAAVKRFVSQRCAVHSSAVQVRYADALPTSESGKRDYATISQRFG
jgi:long-chain acyl-CoA synthetase